MTRRPTVDELKRHRDGHLHAGPAPRRCYHCGEGIERSEPSRFAGFACSRSAGGCAELYAHERCLAEKAEGVRR